MTLIIDSSEWQFADYQAEEIISTMEIFLDVIDSARARGETIRVGEDFQTKGVYGSLDLWSLLSPTSPIQIPEGVWHEITALLHRTSCYLDADEWPDGFAETQISINSEPSAENPDAAWAHHNVRTGHPMACLGLWRNGPCTTLSNKGQAVVHWVATEQDHVNFWRDTIEVEGNDEKCLERLAPHAYPELFFHENFWRGLRRLVGGYFGCREDIKKYLSTLNDHGKWAFTCPPPTLSPHEPVNKYAIGAPSNQVIENRFSGLNLVITPEKPNVHADKRCREAREITIKGKVLYCEWHGKFDKHQNRLHIHQPVAESNDKVVMAIIDAHLPLPGDN